MEGGLKSRGDVFEVSKARARLLIDNGFVERFKDTELIPNNMRANISDQKGGKEG